MMSQCHFADSFEPNPFGMGTGQAGEYSLKGRALAAHSHQGEIIEWGSSGAIHKHLPFADNISVHIGLELNLSSTCLENNLRQARLFDQRGERWGGSRNASMNLLHSCFILSISWQ